MLTQSAGDDATTGRRCRLRVSPGALPQPAALTTLRYLPAMFLRSLTRGLLGTLLCALLPAAQAATLLVSPPGFGTGFVEALAQAQDGDVIEVLPGEYKGVVAVITQKKLTIRGSGPANGKRPVFIADGKSAEGKAILVVREGDITIENLEFRGARVSDANGAGIRFEKGRLKVERCRFVDNQNGILTANFGDAELEIVDSEFSQAPHQVGILPHLLYVGRIGKLTVRGSRFHHGFEGHLIKSRARQNIIAYNMLRDGAAGEASYEVDLPVGGEALLIGNVIGQSPESQNPVLVSYGAEGSVWEKNALVLAHNTLIAEGWLPAWFVRVHRDRVRLLEEPLFVNNLVVGAGIFRLGASGEFTGNWPATLGMLLDVTTGGFELPPDSWLRGRGVDPRNVNGRDLAPRFEFEWPAGTRAISTDRERWSPGAYQR